MLIEQILLHQGAIRQNGQHSEHYSVLTIIIKMFTAKDDRLLVCFSQSNLQLPKADEFIVLSVEKYIVCYYSNRRRYGELFS